jgi:DNA-binding NtrC family response regulator
MQLAPRPSLLIVDDDVCFVRAAVEIARSVNFDVTVAGTVEQARNRVRQATFDLALVDLVLPDGSGLDLLDQCDIATTQIVLITGQPTVESAIRAFKTPILDYVIKPIEPSRYRELLTNAAKRKTLPPPSASEDAWQGLAGTSSALRAVIEQIKRVGPTDATVLVTGESGVGKELVARAIHDTSGRTGELVCVNCGAVPPDLLASQLFGHERGSFTGAQARHVGYFEQAGGGTLFLDEITEMPVHLQVHLLRALENATIRRVGGTEDIEVDVRVVAATNLPPLKAIAEGKLRDDLYYRINEFPIVVSPLRERAEDIETLANLFLARLNQRYGTRKAFTPAAMEQLRCFAWPGNVRQLRNVVNRAFIMARDDAINEPIEDPRSYEPLAETPGSLTVSVGMTFDDIERRMLFKTLRFFDNDKVRTAQALGVSVKTIYNRLARYQQQPQPGVDVGAASAG